MTSMDSTDMISASSNIDRDSNNGSNANNGSGSSSSSSSRVTEIDSSAGDDNVNPSDASDSFNRNEDEGGEFPPPPPPPSPPPSTPPSLPSQVSLSPPSPFLFFPSPPYKADVIDLTDTDEVDKLSSVINKTTKSTVNNAINNKNKKIDTEFHDLKSYGLTTDFIIKLKKSYNRSQLQAIYTAVSTQGVHFT